MSQQCLAAIPGSPGATAKSGVLLLCTERAGHTGEHHHRADHAGARDRGYPVRCQVEPQGHPQSQCTGLAGHTGYHTWSEGVPLEVPPAEASTGVVPTVQLATGLRRLHVSYDGPTGGQRLDLDVIVSASAAAAWFELCQQLGYRFTMRTT